MISNGFVDVLLVEAKKPAISELNKDGDNQGQGPSFQDSDEERQSISRVKKNEL